MKLHLHAEVKPKEALRIRFNEDASTSFAISIMGLFDGVLKAVFVLQCFNALVCRLDSQECKTQHIHQLSLQISTVLRGSTWGSSSK